MTVTLLLLKKIVVLFLILLSGVLLVKLKILKPADSDVLSRICVYLVAPCSVLSAFCIEFTDAILHDLLLSLVCACCVIAVTLIMGTLLKKPLHLNPVEEASVDYSNAGNLIIPLVTATLGPEWVVFCSPFMCVQLIPMWSHGKSVVSGERSYDPKKLFTNINLLAVFAGLILLIFRIQLPDLISSTIDSLGSMIGPVSMLVTGILIGGMEPKRIFANKRVWLTTGLRLVLMPLVSLVILKGLSLVLVSVNLKNIMLITLMASASCTASTITQMAQVFGHDADYAAAICTVTTIGTMLTMPLLTLLYNLWI